MDVYFMMMCSVAKGESINVKLKQLLVVKIKIKFRSTFSSQTALIVMYLSQFLLLFVSLIRLVVISSTSTLLIALPSFDASFMEFYCDEILCSIHTDRDNLGLCLVHIDNLNFLNCLVLKYLYIYIFFLLHII